MSTQDPYGNPPQQPYGQQPPGGAQGFGSGPGYPPPPPPKKRTGLIIGAIVAALVLIGGGVAAGIVLLGGDDDKDTSSESAKDEPTDEESEEPTDEPTAEPTEEPTDGGNEVLGTNYTFSLPDQWTDATAEFNAAGTPVDSGAIWGDSAESNRANVIVEAGSADGSTLDQQREGWESNLKAGGGSLERLPDVTIDGEPAYAVEIQRTNAAGNEIIQSVYLTIHQEIVYSIAFSGPPGDDEAEAAFDTIQSSWSWTS
jgi:hypothetical protein